MAKRVICVGQIENHAPPPVQGNGTERRRRLRTVLRVRGMGDVEERFARTADAMSEIPIAHGRTYTGGILGGFLFSVALHKVIVYSDGISVVSSSIGKAFFSFSHSQINK